jgi:hypothetical protein
LPFCGAIAYIALQEFCFRGGWAAAEWSVMLKFLRGLTAVPAVKYSIIAVTSFLWLVGFADQLPDVEQTVKYVGISLLMLAVAAMA